MTTSRSKKPLLIEIRDIVREQFDDAPQFKVLFTQAGLR